MTSLSDYPAGGRHRRSVCVAELNMGMLSLSIANTGLDGGGEEVGTLTGPHYPGKHVMFLYTNVPVVLLLL